MCHGIYHAIYLGIYNGIYHGIYLGINYGIYHGKHHGKYGKRKIPWYVTMVRVRVGTDYETPWARW